MAETQLPKGYEPADVEARWREHWEKNKTFTPDADGSGEPFSIVIPPPNVTGALHIGHALNQTIQDILCRFQRQQGRKVLWLPGMDHAGIATQNVVEKMLAKEGKSRHDLGRGAFVDKVWEWKEEYGGKILNQIRMLGSSVDWTRERFTMDEGLSRAVRQVFVSLYEEGLIYKGEYIINWCNRCHTALADDEVEHVGRQDKIYKILYPFEKGEGGLTVATTRPETLLGDTAVAVHPEDERYNERIGDYVVLPLVGRRLQIIGDKYVDKEFGTGCLKVTPAHDMNDWELGRTHNLEIISVLDDAGYVNENAPERFCGMFKDDARKAALKELAEQNLLIGEEDLEHNVGVCYRCKSVIEPHVSEQWFVAVKPLAEKARAAVPQDTEIFPDNWTKVYYQWMDNIRDWCISRQLWWGHRIPAWTCEDCGELIVSMDDPDTCTKCNSANLTQDEDVLDTWFSSALWPFSTLGWPDKTKDLQTFYPTTILVTAFDIIFFWVARMMMMGIHFMGEVPFKHVYIHALVRDAEGKKMSKSVGNVIDPLDMINKYGCDSLRFTLAAFAAMGRDIKLSEDRIEGYRHFVNKIWNAARFTLMNLPESFDKAPLDYPVETVAGVHHGWLFHRLEEVKGDVTTAVTEYRFNDAAQALYKFTWHEFCDWYLECIKPELNSEDPETTVAAQACLWTALRELLILLHPFMPFVSSEIWGYLPNIETEDLATVRYPESRPQRQNAEAAARMDLLQQAIVSVRTIRAELNIGPSAPLTLLVKTVNDHDKQVLDENQGLIKTLARVETMQTGPDVSGPKAAATAVVNGNELFVPLAGAVNFDDELARLDKELKKLEKDLTGVEKKLANQGFLAKAPANVVEKEKEKAATMAEKRDKLTALRERLQSAMEG